MKKYSVEVKTILSECWDSDSVQDGIVAESEEEAVELAKDYLKQFCIDNDEDLEQVDKFEFRVKVVHPTNIEILMADGCTRKEAEMYLLSGTVIFDDFEENFDIYMKELNVVESDIQEYRRMIEIKKPIFDWGIVDLYEEMYYIMYVL